MRWDKQSPRRWFYNLIKNYQKLPKFSELFVQAVEKKIFDQEKDFQEFNQVEKSTQGNDISLSLYIDEYDYHFHEI